MVDDFVVHDAIAEYSAIRDEHDSTYLPAMPLFCKGEYALRFAHWPYY